jgi:hypothetical protein
MTSGESELDDLRREFVALKKRFDILDAGMRAAVDRLDADFAANRTAVNQLVHNNGEQKAATIAVVDAQHVLVDEVARLKATLDLVFRTERTIQ